MRMRLVLDTNVVVAALRSQGGASRLWMASILRGEHIVLISVPIIIEYEAALTRREHLSAMRLTSAHIARFLDGLCSVAEHVDTNPFWRPVLRDPNDEMVLEAAAQGRADLLLTFIVRDFVGCERFGVKAINPGPAWRQTGVTAS